jgi:hypothetical protein
MSTNAKVAVVNFSGNSTKTTITKNVLAPRLANLLSVIHIESINSTGDDNDTEIQAKKLRELNAQLSMMSPDESIVVDIGASNVESVLEQIASSLETIVTDIDLWVIPVTPDKKVKVDTVNTAKALLSVGVPANKITIVASKVTDANVADEFAAVIRDAGALKIRFLQSYVPYADVIQNASRTIPSMAADETDFVAEIQKLDRHDPRRADLAMLRVDTTSARKLNRIFDAVFTELFQK